MRLRHVARHVGHALGVSLLFLGFVTLSVVLHLNLELSRRGLALEVDRWLSAELRGKVTLSGIDDLGFGSVSIRHISVLDLKGRKVIELNQVTAKVAVVQTLFDWLTSNKKLTISVEQVRVKDAEVAVLAEPNQQQPSLVSALSPTTEAPETLSTKPSRPFRVWFPSIEIEQVRGRSTLTSLPTMGGLASQVRGQLLATPAGVAIDISHFAAALRTATGEELRGNGTLSIRTPARVEGSFTGHLGAVELSTRIEYKNGEFEGTLNAPQVDPAAAQALWDGWPLLQSIDLSILVKGPIERLVTRATVSSSFGQLESNGVLELLATPIRLRMELEMAGIDLQLLALSAPSSRLDGDATLDLTLADSRYHLTVDGKLLPGSVNHVETPLATFTLTSDPEGTLAAISLREPGATLRAALYRHPAGTLELDAQFESSELAQFTRLSSAGMAFSGFLSARVAGTLTNDELTLSSTGEFRSLATRGLRLGSGTFVVALRGPEATADALVGSLSVESRDAATPVGSFKQLGVELSGNWQAGHLSAHASNPELGDLQVDSEFRISSLLELLGTSARLVHGRHELSVHAAHLSIGNKLVALDGFEMSGTAGQLVGQARVGEDALRLQASTAGLDLSQVGDMLGVPADQLSGMLRAEVNVNLGQDDGEGQWSLALAKASVGPLHELDLDSQFQLHGRLVTGRIEGRSNGLFTLESDATLTLAGADSFWITPSATTGMLRISLEPVDLARLSALLGEPLGKPGISGTASARLEVRRTQAQSLPHITLSVATNELTFPWKGGRTQPIEMSGLDLLLGASFEGETNRTELELTVHRGETPLIHASSRFQLFPPDTLTSLLAWQTTLEKTPAQLFVELPKQSAGAGIGRLWPIPFDGMVEGRLWAVGNPMSPRLVVDGSISHLLFENSPTRLPLDVTAIAEWIHDSGEFQISAELARNGRTLTTLNGAGELAVPFGAGAAKSADYSGTLELALLGMPLQELPWLPAALELGGSLRGSVRASRTAGQTRFSGVVPIDNATVGSLPLGETLFGCQQLDDELVAQLRLIDGGAMAELEARIPLDSSSLIPRLRTEQPTVLTAKAAGYDAQILTPLLGRSVSDFGGRVDADIRATWLTETDHMGQKSLVTRLGGKASIQQGHLTLRDLDLSVSDISLVAQASSTGTRTTLSVPRFSGSVRAPQPNVFGSASLDFDQLHLTRVVATIDRAEQMPLVISGVTQATLTGGAGIELIPYPDRISVTLHPRKLQVRLPERTANAPVGLADNPDVVILQPLGETAYAKSAAKTTPWDVDIILDRDTRVTRSDLTLLVSGSPHLHLDKRLVTSGNMVLEPSGRLQLLGKVFVIERGTISLDPEDAENPRFDVTASWRGPTHLVVARVQGTRKEAKLQLSSDPPAQNEAEVQALLLGTRSDDTASTTAGAGLGAALLNQAFSDTALGSVEIRTSQDEQHANYTAAVPLKDNLWFEATYKSPEATSPRPGAATREAGFSGTMDWRFRRDWSLRTELGTLGAGVDLLWQYRY